MSSAPGDSPPNSPARRGFRPNRQLQRSRKIPPPTGTETGSASNPDFANTAPALALLRGEVNCAVARCAHKSKRPALVSGALCLVGA